MTKPEGAQPLSDSSDVLTTREAAEVLGVSLKSVQHWCESGVLRSWKTAGGHRRVLKTSVEALIRSRATEAAPTHPGPVGSAGLTVYVVEDDPIYQKLFRMKLASWSPSPRLLTFSSGYEALVRIGQEIPDLLITDVRMPGMSGIEMLRALQRMPECAGIEVIVVSMLSAEELEDMGGVPAGVTVMGKPPAFNEIERIARALGKVSHPN
jgi:excisionase family DNA binding protein